MMKLTLCIGLLCFSSWITILQGAESPVDKSVDRAKPKPMCLNPRRNVGDSLLNGCDKRTCIQIKNKADWHEEFAYESCCWQNQAAYEIGETFSSSKDPDTGIETTLRCAHTSSGSPHIVVDVSAENCENPEIAEQVKEISESVKQTNNKLQVTNSKIGNIENGLQVTNSKIVDIENELQVTNSKVGNIENELQVTNSKIENIGNELEIVKKLLISVLHIIKPGEQSTTTTTSTSPTTTLAPMVEGVLITGGYGALTSTELFLPHTGKTCSLQSLPDNRRWHSIDTIAEKIILCGGYHTQTSCLEFLPTSSTGSWAHYATLAQGRYLHTSHVFQGELLLLGGDVSRGTTEIIGKGTQFNLQQDTLRACSIPDHAATILTGGWNSGSSWHNSVVRYNMQGFVENLPDLATARSGHGCGYYMDNGNKVLVVAGGYNGAYLSLTELLPAGATAWTSGESLPRTLWAPSSTNMHGYLLLIGGNSGGNRGEVLKFDGTWTEVGMMKTARYLAGATKIEIPGEGGSLDISGCI